MDRFVVKGPTPLEGEIAVGGAKNAVLPLMAAALLARGKTVIENVPDLVDVRFFMTILEELGAVCVLDQSKLTIDTTNQDGCNAPYDLVRKMRASIYVLGPLLAYHGEARVSLPGGCAWGPRPVNLHLDAMQALGAELDLDQGYIVGKTKGRLKGTRFRFEPVSVGATANVLMAAVLAEGVSELENCAVEPEITGLAEALVRSGAKIDGIGTLNMRIEGVQELAPLKHRVMADRIEAGTFMAGVAMTTGRVTMTRVNPLHLQSVISVLQDIGCEISVDNDLLTVEMDRRPRSIEVITRPYPGFPTDMQAQIMAVCALAEGTSFLTDSIYNDRFTHVSELNRLGADIRLDGSKATVFGAEKLQGAPVMATDLRASAALVLAGAAAHGTTEVNRVYHIDRGYEKIEIRLAALGANIKREAY